jgi:hypothetical protein
LDERREEREEETSKLLSRLFEGQPIKHLMQRLVSQFHKMQDDFVLNIVQLDGNKLPFLLRLMPHERFVSPPFGSKGQGERVRKDMSKNE